jgi:predicted small secreted protein
MKTMTLFLLLVSVVLISSGCETVRGIGKDIENTGRNIQEGMARSNTAN